MKCLIFLLAMLGFLSPSQAQTSPDVAIKLMQSWDPDLIDKICDSLKLDHSINEFNGLSAGKFDDINKYTTYQSDDLSYFFKGKISTVYLYFRKDVLIGRTYLFDNMADFVLASMGMMDRLQMIPLSTKGGKGKESEYLYESNKYIITQVTSADSRLGFIKILNKSQLK